MIRLFPLVVALAFGLCFSAVAHEEKHKDPTNATVNLSQEQVEAGHFAVHEARPGQLSKRIKVPGSIIPSGDRIARVAVKLLGTVWELRKRLGDSVKAGEVVAVIESREAADAKSEYLAARLVFDLQQTLFNRASKLFNGKVLSENNYLWERTTFEDARIKFETARQKLFALSLNAEQIDALPQQPVETLRLQELRAPIGGRIAERRVEIGSLVGREGQESELYVIADLGVVWADLAIPASQLANIKEGQKITISAGTGAEPAPAIIMFISPLLDKNTRAARVIASVDNATGRWLPGTFVTADIRVDQQADLVVLLTALQSIKGEPVVFVRNREGFEARKVSVGRRDGRMAEIVLGLTAGERVATFNTFILKSEIGKAEIDRD